MEYQPAPNVNELIAEILRSQFDDQPVSGIRFVGNGSVNAVYVASVSNREVVVRLADARYRATDHPKEAWCIERAAANGIPGPQTLAVGRSEQTVYMVQEYLHGTRGDDPSVDKIKVWREIGRYARLIHKIDLAGFPGRQCNSDGLAQSHWERYVVYNLESLTANDQLIALNVYRPSDQEKIRSVFERLQRRSFQFGLIHNDLSVWNTIVTADGKIYLFDWGCAGVDIVPHAEIASILRWLDADDEHFSAFLEGYGLSKSDFAAIYPAIKEFRLLNAFDLVRWAIDNRQDQLNDYVANARTMMESLASL